MAIAVGISRAMGLLHVDVGEDVAGLGQGSRLGRVHGRRHLLLHAGIDAAQVVRLDESGLQRLGLEDLERVALLDPLLGLLLGSVDAAPAFSKTSKKSIPSAISLCMA
jgi:hypothetical protein